MTRSTARTKARFALAAAMALVAVSCVSSGGTRPRPEPPADPTFLDPLTAGREAQVLFEVEADDAEYWRLNSLDMYDGVSWTRSNGEGSEGGSLTAPVSLPTVQGGSPPDSQTLDQTFHILRDSLEHALPMAQTAEQIDVSNGHVRWDRTTGSAFLEGDLEAGMTYTIRSRIVVPTPEELDHVEYAAPSTYGSWTALPEDLDPRIEQIAERWTADATTDYRKVLAIQERFQEGDFVYSEAVDPRVNVYTLLDFLTRTKTGFCAHYSSAMALMVRTLGLPARIGEGFRAGTPQADGSFLVTSRDAHVWVEVWFPGYGWLQFEPEAGTDHPNAQPGNYLDP